MCMLTVAAFLVRVNTVKDNSSLEKKWKYY